MYFFTPKKCFTKHVLNNCRNKNSATILDIAENRVHAIGYYGHNLNHVAQKIVMMRQN